MSNIQIVTDSTAYMLREQAIEKEIEIVPLSVYFNGTVTNEGFPGEFNDFFEALMTSKDFPTTSQPSAEAFKSVYEKALACDKEVIVIVISSKLSGTYNSASVAAKMVDENRISVIDSETTASNLRILVERAKELSEEGKPREEIVKIINEEKSRMSINLTVDTLDYLKKGGRLTDIQAFIGSILNIKPIIALVEGKLVPVGKARGKSKAIDMMVSNIPMDVKIISICQISALEEAEQIKHILSSKFAHAHINIDDLGPVIGAHLGPKAIGICFTW
ncbi:MAG: DegV family protein [Firmicutes bacterium HGW-Firmicutes-1]|jgi:DegV family protein with EDD domain|nr:MAG: DegV family protein [Firmicutes bacterium HGW-Firmicutes-1]